MHVGAVGWLARRSNETGAPSATHCREAVCLYALRLVVMDEVVGNCRSPTRQAVFEVIVGRRPQRMIVDEVHVRVVLEPAAPGILDVMEKVRSDGMPSDAPITLAGQLMQTTAAPAHFIRVADLETHMMKSNIRRLREGHDVMFAVVSAAEESDDILGAVGQAHAQTASVKGDTGVHIRRKHQD